MMQTDGGHGYSGGAEGGGGGTGEGVRVGWGQPPPLPLQSPSSPFCNKRSWKSKTKFINQQKSHSTIPLEIRYHKQIGHLRKPME